MDIFHIFLNAVEYFKYFFFHIWGIIPEGTQRVLYSI